jgi:hypothetical protein
MPAVLATSTKRIAADGSPGRQKSEQRGIAAAASRAAARMDVIGYRAFKNLEILLSTISFGVHQA